VPFWSKTRPDIWRRTPEADGVGSVGDVRVGAGNFSSEGEHDAASNARRTQAVRQITTIHLDRVLRITAC